jgi:hypothetical protein
MGIAESLTDKDTSGWDVRNVQDMTDMFVGAKDFKQDISGWDISKVQPISQHPFG